MSDIIPDDDYSPYDFLITLTCTFGTIFIVGPLLVPRGPDQDTIRIGIRLASFYMWIAWVTVYSSQVHPISGLRFKRTTLAWLSYSWGNAKGVQQFSLPTTTTTRKPTTSPTVPTTTSATSTQSSKMWIPPELLTTVRATRSTIPPTTTKATTNHKLYKQTTASKTSLATTATTKPTLTTREATTRQATIEEEIFTLGEWQAYTMFKVAHSEDNKGFLEFLVLDDDKGPTLLLTNHEPTGRYPAIELVMLSGYKGKDFKIHSKDKNNRRYTRFVKEGAGAHPHYRVEWNGAKIDVSTFKGYGSSKKYTHLFTWTNPDPFLIEHGGVMRGYWKITAGLVGVLSKKYYDPDPKVHQENENLRANVPDSTSRIRLRTGTAFLLAYPHYSFYKVTMEPISFSVLAELDDYREFFILLSTTESRSEPRITIHIGGEYGRECTLSKNGIIKVRIKCKVDWRKNTYLPFYVWHKNGKIVVTSGYDSSKHARRLIHWNDPDPFAVHFYGLRSSDKEEIPMLVKDVEDEDWEFLCTTK